MERLTRRTLLGRAALAAGWAVPASAAPAAPREPRWSQSHADPALYLLVDDGEVERAEGLARFVNRPRKQPEPVVTADRPWEGERAQAWGSVIQEPDGRLRLWYFAFNTERRPSELDRGGYAYAESRDGLRWRKPALGLVEFRGSRRNNLFYTFAPDGRNLVDEELARRGLGLPALDESGRPIGVLNNADGLTVVRDDDDPDPARRYKLIANMQDHRMWAPYYPDRYPDVTPEQLRQARAVFGQYLDTSPDGLHWTRRPRRLLGSVGDYMMVTRDHRGRQWWLNERAAGRGGRNAALRTSRNLERWSDPVIVFDNGADSEYGKLFEWHGGITPFNYGRVNLGLLEKWSSAGMGCTCELVCQREGGPWQRVAPGTPFLDVGPEGAFDRVLAYPTHNAPARIDDRLLLFYTGGGAKTDPKKGIPMSIGLATLGRDRFAGLGSWRGRTPGRLLTKPLEVGGDRAAALEVNVELLEQLPLRVAVTGLDGKPLPGYEADASVVEPLPGRVYSRVRWGERAGLAPLRGRPARLEFEIRGAVLYGFRLRPGE